jgi:hypothetical protein
MLKLQAISNTETSSVTSRPTAHVNSLAFAVTTFESPCAALLVLLPPSVCEMLFLVAVWLVVLPSAAFAMPFMATRKPLRKITCERVKPYITFQVLSDVSEDPYT